MPDTHPELPLDPDTPVHLRASSVTLAFAGGAVGTLARVLLSDTFPTRTGAWPWGTLAANLVGSFVLGALLEELARRGPDTGLRQRLRLLLGTGFCGGLTTYSTFAVEADLLVSAHASGLALTYLAVSLVAGTVLAWAGIVVATGRHAR